MRKCITCVRKIIEEEGNKNSDANAKSSFLLFQETNFCIHIRYFQTTHFFTANEGTS
ncbi:hypothetical protein GHT06_009839 [Daphnia sinensis]|uniref:Uncharacterized protein n=1 Tax=Daphnia sinensis TaxID=1820382 RepID=A0AAD5Q3I3_9CRUS|nr:hypothetical protein GHT06_009839 [Daphnia sinensis]